MSENLITFGRKRYTAVDGYACEFCHLQGVCLTAMAPCSPEDRWDGRNVIFKEKQVD